LVKEGAWWLPKRQRRVKKGISLGHIPSHPALMSAAAKGWLHASAARSIRKSLVERMALRCLQGPALRRALEGITL